MRYIRLLHGRKNTQNSHCAVGDFAVEALKELGELLAIL